jgi:flagellar basal body-associated protein FliL
MNGNQQSPQKPTKGYGKHSIWYWILIYVVVGAIVYGLIYLLFFSGGGGAPSY